ncbi:hypothetical protein BC940DRAFT_287918 [Gongronella butleri]|nr:hypothetical protein BC940DRAFT_287918 [Gongronella butleri]
MMIDAPISVDDAPLKARKPHLHLSWSSTSSSFSVASFLSSTSTPATTITTITTPQSHPGSDDFFNPTESAFKALVHACSHGETAKVKQLVIDRTYNLDDTDDPQMGTTPLIYAACFGYADIVDVLVQEGVDLDKQDKNGWTALMWATINNHSHVVERLLDHGASTHLQTHKGRSLQHFLDDEHEKVAKLIQPYLPVASMTAADDDTAALTPTTRRKYQVLDDFDRLDQETTQLHPSTSSSRSTRPSWTLVASLSPDDDDLISCERSMQSIHHFVWNRCLPDQMYVFAEDDVDHLLSVLITDLKLPMKSRQENWLPANVLFLAARYAHYYTNRDLLQSLLGGAMTRIALVLQGNKGDIHTLAFWLANLTQLLYYLKRDTHLVVATAEQQLEISELVSETYALLVIDSERRLEKILEASMLTFDSIGGEPVQFSDDWHRFFRRRPSSRRPSSMMVLATAAAASSSSPAPSVPSSPLETSTAASFTASSASPTTSLPTSPRPGDSNTMASMVEVVMNTPSSDWPTCTMSPHSITSLLSSILYVLQSYEVHPSIIVQAVAQFFYFMGCELFNRILMNKKYTCRSKALQVRMNLSVIEDWLREQQPFLPSHLTTYLDPLIQLLQLLQCLSQLNDLQTFISTTQGFDLLNPLQIKRCVLYYRYEVDETRLPDAIEKYTTRLPQQPLPPPAPTTPSCASSSPSTSLSRASSSSTAQANGAATANEASTAASPTSSRPTSVSSLGSLLMAKWSSATTNAPAASEKGNEDATTTSPLSTYPDLDDDDQYPGQEPSWLVEQRDANYTLPFSLPTSSSMMHYDHVPAQTATTDATTQERQQQTPDTSASSTLPQQPHAHNQTSSHHPLSLALYKALRQKLGVDARCRKTRERMVVPTIPQEWIPILDRHNDNHNARTAMDFDA